MDRARQDRRVPLAIALGLLVTGLFAVCVGLQLGGAKTSLWVDDLVTPLAALTACVLCFRARARHTGRMRAFWVLFGCATACWTLAEVIWGVYALILREEVPIPSWADVGYLAAIPLAVAGLVVHPSMRVTGTRRARAVLDGMVIAAALLFLSWTLVLGPLWRTTDLSTLGGIVTLAYPFGDVVMVFFIVIAIRHMSGEHRLSLWCLLAGLLAMALSDSTYSYLSEVANYSSSSTNLVDAGWVAAYLGIAVAALSSDNAGARLATIEQAGPPSLASLLSPLLPVLVALSVTAIEIRLGHRLDRAGWLMAFGLIALVLTRQGLAVLELLAPRPGTRTGFLARVADTAHGGADS